MRRVRRLQLPRLCHRSIKMRGKANRWDNDAKENGRAKTRDRDNWPKQIRPRRSHATQTRAANNVHALHIPHTNTHQTQRVVFREISYLTARREITLKQRQLGRVHPRRTAAGSALRAVGHLRAERSHSLEAHGGKSSPRPTMERRAAAAAAAVAAAARAAAAPTAGRPERGVATAACAQRIDARSSA